MIWALRIGLGLVGIGTLVALYEAFVPPKPPPGISIEKDRQLRASVEELIRTSNDPNVLVYHAQKLAAVGYEDLPRKLIARARELAGE